MNGDEHSVAVPGEPALPRRRERPTFLRMSPLPALVVALLVSGLGWMASALTRGGALAAAIVGTIILSGTGGPGLAALGVFFVTGSALSHWLESGPGKAPRGAWQVVSNGGAAAVGALLAPVSPGLAVWVVGASLAAATADTWATAIGSRSRVSPRHLLSGRMVDPGTDGGVTFLGTSGAVAGAVLVTSGVWITGGGVVSGWEVVAMSGTGVAGMLVDSLLGEGVQRRIHCVSCDIPSRHLRCPRCGQVAPMVGGWRWMTNDSVNAVTTAAAGAAGALYWAWRA